MRMQREARRVKQAVVPATKSRLAMRKAAEQGLAKARINLKGEMVLLEGLAQVVRGNPMKNNLVVPVSPIS